MQSEAAQKRCYDFRKHNRKHNPLPQKEVFTQKEAEERTEAILEEEKEIPLQLY